MSDLDLTSARDCREAARDADRDATREDIALMLQFAQVDAAIALVEEQRTANLIAYLALRKDEYGGQGIATDVERRLGLDGAL